MELCDRVLEKRRVAAAAKRKLKSAMRRLSNKAKGIKSLQIDGPVSAVDEGFPRLVLGIVELYGQERAALWLDRMANQFHVRFLRRAATFADVAGDAGADDVFPTGIAAAAARHDVVEAEFAGGEQLAAILAMVGVAGEQVAAIEAERLRAARGRTTTGG